MTQAAIDLTGFVNVAVTVASANAVLPEALADGRVTVVLVSDTNLFWNSGPTAVTATAADKFLPAGTALEFKLPLGHDNIGAIRKTADGTLTIYVSA